MTTAATMNVMTPRYFPARRTPTAGLPDEKLSESSQAVLRRDLKRGHAECDDAQEYDDSVDAMNEPVRLGQNLQTREVSRPGPTAAAWENRSTTKNEAAAVSPPKTPSTRLSASQFDPLATEGIEDHLTPPREWVVYVV